MSTLRPSAAFLAVSLAYALSSCALFRTSPPEYPPVTLPSGVVIQDLVVPDEGEPARPGDYVSLNYELELDDGTRVDSSYERGQPLDTRLGEGVLPLGIELGITGMRVFGRRSILVPPELGYGSEGLEDRVPPDAVLRVLVELMSRATPPLD